VSGGGRQQILVELHPGKEEMKKTQLGKKPTSPLRTGGNISHNGLKNEAIRIMRIEGREIVSKFESKPGKGPNVCKPKPRVSDEKGS